MRKKSSKLADFESPDEIDTRFKRKTDRPQKSPQKVMRPQERVYFAISENTEYSEDFV